MKIEQIQTNGNCRIYWCRALIHEEEAHFRSGERVSLFGVPLEGLPEMVLEIPGVRDILTRRFAIWVCRNPAYDWAEIEPRIVSLLEEYEKRMGVA